MCVCTRAYCDEGRKRENAGCGEEEGGSQPAAPSAADRFIEWHVPIRSNVVLYFSAFRAAREQRRASPKRAKSPAGSPPIGSPSPPARKRDRLAMSLLSADSPHPSPGGVLPLWTFLDDSRRVPKTSQGGEEGERKRENGRNEKERKRENYEAAIRATST